VAARTIVPIRSDADLISDYNRSLTDAEKWDLNEEVKKANPGVDPRVSAKEFSAVKRAFILKKALEARDSRTLSPSLSSAGKDKAITKDGSSLSFAGTKGAANIAAPKLSDPALLLEFACSLTDRENWDIHNDVTKANPGLSEKKLCEVKRAVMLRKAHAWKGRLDEQDKSKEASSSVPLVKDSPSSLLNLGTIKPVDGLTLKAQQESPSQDARPYACLTLTKEERVSVAAATKISNPGCNEDAVDLSLSSLSDSDDGSGEESDTLEDGKQAISSDLLRQRQVSSLTSPKENEYLTGFMRSPAKPLPEIKAKQLLDKEPLSLITPTKQVDIVSMEAEGIQKAGDVSGHGGSMSAQHGSVSPIAFHDKHLADRQSAVDVIRNGSSLSLQHSVEANGNDSNASLQFDASKPDEKLGDCPTSPTTQALQVYQDNASKDIQERKEAAEERKRNKKREKLPAPSSSNVEGQRVLT
jgi:hypothetical protein